MNNIDNDLILALELALRGNIEESEKILLNLENLNDPRVIFNLGWYNCFRGNLSKGIAYMSAGRMINCFGLPRLKGTIWKEEDLKGKVLLFRSEGGFGDQIINFRFAKDFEDMGAKVIVGCSAELQSFFTKHGFLTVENPYCDAIHYDYWIPAMSAPHVLGYEYETLSGKPYLFSDKSKKLYNKKGNLKVGLKWSGRPEFEHEQHRRFDRNLMIDLHQIEGATFYSLQKDDNLVDGLPFADLRDQMKTWDETAAIIDDLDLVITSCTSIAHMSAALGKETWVVVPCLPYYLWAMPGDKSKWYDSVRLFRQVEFGNWNKPFQDITKALKEKIDDLRI